MFMGLIFSLAANERSRQIGVLRALGAPQATVLRSLLMEAIFLALAGGVAGNVLAALCLVLMRGPITQWARVPILLPAPLPFLGLALVGLLLALVTVTPAALVPASRASRQEPALAMRE